MGKIKTKPKGNLGNKICEEEEVTFPKRTVKRKLADELSTKQPSPLVNKSKQSNTRKIVYVKKAKGGEKPPNHVLEKGKPKESRKKTNSSASKGAPVEPLTSSKSSNETDQVMEEDGIRMTVDPADDDFQSKDSDSNDEAANSSSEVEEESERMNDFHDTEQLNNNSTVATANPVGLNVLIGSEEEAQNFVKQNPHLGNYFRKMI